MNCDVIAGHMTAGELTQFIFYAGIVAMGFGALSETWGDLQRAAGASERLTELLHIAPDVQAPEHPIALPEPAKGAVEFGDVVFRYPSRLEHAALNGFSLRILRHQSDVPAQVSGIE